MLQPRQRALAQMARVVKSPGGSRMIRAEVFFLFAFFCAFCLWPAPIRAGSARGRSGNASESRTKHRRKPTPLRRNDPPVLPEILYTHAAESTGHFFHRKKSTPLQGDISSTDEGHRKISTPYRRFFTLMWWKRGEDSLHLTGHFFHRW